MRNAFSTTYTQLWSAKKKNQLEVNRWDFSKTNEKNQSTDLGNSVNPKTEKLSRNHTYARQSLTTKKQRKKSQIQKILKGNKKKREGIIKEAKTSLQETFQQKWRCIRHMATGLEKVSFHSDPKERQCQRMIKLPHNCTHLTC